MKIRLIRPLPDACDLGFPAKEDDAIAACLKKMLRRRDAERAGKGRKVLHIWERAGIDFHQWEQFAYQCAPRYH